MIIYQLNDHFALFLSLSSHFFWSSITIITFYTQSYRTSGVSGLINRNRKSSCYLTQEDYHQPYLSVIELMQMACNLKLKAGVEHEPVINEILRNLNLNHRRCNHAKQLSGGERRRLSIALELVANPTIFYLDEPTSGKLKNSNHRPPEWRTGHNNEMVLLMIWNSFNRSWWGDSRTMYSLATKFGQTKSNNCMHNSSAVGHNIRTVRPHFCAGTRSMRLPRWSKCDGAIPQ